MLCLSFRVELVTVEIEERFKSYALKKIKKKRIKESNQEEHVLAGRKMCLLHVMIPTSSSSIKQDKTYGGYGGGGRTALYWKLFNLCQYERQYGIPIIQEDGCCA